MSLSTDTELAPVPRSQYPQHDYGIVYKNTFKFLAVGTWSMPAPGQQYHWVGSIVYLAQSLEVLSKKES